MKSTAMTYVSAPNESNIYSVLIKKNIHRFKQTIEFLLQSTHMPLYSWGVGGGGDAEAGGMYKNKIGAFLE